MCTHCASSDRRFDGTEAASSSEVWICICECLKLDSEEQAILLKDCNWESREIHWRENVDKADSIG